MWVFHPELMMAGFVIQAKLTADVAQIWAKILTPPARGLVVPYRPRSRIPHHFDQPAQILRLADHQ